MEDITNDTLKYSGLCRLASKAIADQFLQFLKGYIKAEKEAINGNFRQFGSIFYIFEENNNWKKNEENVIVVAHFNK